MYICNHRILCIYKQSDREAQWKGGGDEVGGTHELRGTYAGPTGHTEDDGPKLVR